MKKGTCQEYAIIQILGNNDNGAITVWEASATIITNNGDTYEESVDIGYI